MAREEGVVRTYLGKNTTFVVMILMVGLSGLLALDAFGYISTSLEMLEGVLMLGIAVVILSETQFEKNKNQMVYYAQLLLGIGAGILALNGLLGEPEAIKWLVDWLLPFKAWLFALWTVVLAKEIFVKDLKK